MARPNRRPQDGTIDKPSLLDIAPSSAVWLQPPKVRPALHKVVASPAIPLTVTGEFNRWMVGVGGECDRFSPPAGAAEGEYVIQCRFQSTRAQRHRRLQLSPSAFFLFR
jgi:hypothetical protein